MINKPLILIVDDDRFSRLVLKDLLKNEKYEFIEATNGRDGVIAFIENQPDIVLLDADMPIMDGFTACERIRELPQGYRIPILMLTGLTDEKSIDRAFAVGASEYISKPINRAVLINRIKRILASAEVEKKMMQMSLQDSLTGLYNRTYFTEGLDRLEGGRLNPVGIVVCDVDELKQVNDTLGHDQGDELLKTAAVLISGAFREGDIVARIGGDEFSVLLPISSEKEVEETCQRLRQAVDMYNANSNQNFIISISIGFAVGNVPQKISVQDLFKEADNNMYQEKLNHRKEHENRIIELNSK